MWGLIIKFVTLIYTKWLPCQLFFIVVCFCLYWTVVNPKWSWHSILPQTIGSFQQISLPSQQRPQLSSSFLFPLILIWWSSISFLPFELNDVTATLLLICDVCSLRGSKAKLKCKMIAVRLKEQMYILLPCMLSLVCKHIYT